MGVSEIFGHTSIVLWSVSNSEIIDNYFEIESNYPAFLDFRSILDHPSFNNTVINNEIHGGVISDQNESLNIYCVNGIGNHYFDGATGPTCPDFDNDGINDYFDKCPLTTTDQIAYGCDCLQILELKGMGDKDGCNKGIINNFIDLKGWAKDLFN